MKLAIFFTLAFTLYATAESKAQKITLNLTDVPLREVMKEIQKQQGYSFLFRGDEIADMRVDVHLKEAEFTDAMRVIVEKRGLAWSLDDGIITIKPSRVYPPTATQQQRAISGRVTDEQGNPLEGVTVRVKGTSSVVITNSAGNYRLPLPVNSSVLVYSMLGFRKVEYQVIDQRELDVIMRTEVSGLDEVVVVGYGEQRRRDVTGSVVSIKPDDFQDMPQTNIVQLLQGKLPGLHIRNTGSTAEGDVSMRIRSRNSINADAPPLIILDGIQYDGFLSELNPNDIESIEVLKDASSAAIYGARAANGVLLITTKTGKAGERRINFDSNVGFSDLVNIPEMMDASDYYQFKLQRMGYVAVFEENNYQDDVNTNWLDLVMRTGVRQEYNLSVAGGNENTTYFISGNGVFVDGNAINDTYNRYTVRLNMETKVNSWIRFGTHTSLGYFDRPGDVANLNTAMQMNPLTRPHDDTGRLNFRPNPDDLSMVNPLEPLNYTKEDVARGAITNNYLRVDAPFLEGLSYRLLTGFNFRNRLIEQYKSSANTLSGSQVGGEANLNNQYKQDWSVENIVNYQKDFGLHAVHLTGVYSARKYVTKYHNIHGVGFPDDIRSYYQFKDAAALTASDTYTQESSLSQMLRINYNYAGKYLLTATIRRDGFSAFGSNNKYGVFPSIAVGWNMESEPFFENVTVLNSSKLRVSYGENGNQAISPYAAMPSMSTQYYLDEAGNTLVGFYPNKLADPSLSWETTRQINAGWDFSWFNGRLFGTLDYFYANTFDLLLSKNIPQINGVQSIRQNVGRTRSSGFELAITTANVRRENFSWRTRFNFSHNKNRIIDVGLFDEAGNPVDNLGSRWFIGEPISVIYGYQFDGIWQETDDILNSHMPTAKPGDIKVLDYDKDNQISTDDRHIIGYQDPHFRAGLLNTLHYKRLTLSLFLNAVYGGMRWTEYMNTYFEKNNIRQRDWWTPENPINTYPENRDDSNPYQVAYFGKANDASFLRLSDISLGYTLPEYLLQKINVNRLEVFGNVKNVMTLTNYVGLDPEFTSDFGTPLARTFILGIRFGL